MDARKLEKLTQFIQSGYVQQKDDLINFIESLESVTFLDGSYFMIGYDNSLLPIIYTVSEVELNQESKTIKYKLNGELKQINSPNMSIEDLGTLYESKSDAIVDFTSKKLLESDTHYNQLAKILEQIQTIQSYV